MSGANALIAPGGEVTCLVSGGADSTCLWHVARGARLRRPRRPCPPRAPRRRGGRRRRALRSALGARVVACAAGGDRGGAARASLCPDRGAGLRATGHTASDQVETVLYRLVSSGSTRGIRARRDGRRRAPAAAALARGDRGVLPRARAPVARRLDERRHEARADPRAAAAAARGARPARSCEPARARAERAAPPAALEASLVELLSSPGGTRSADLGSGIRAVRAYDTLRLEGSVTGAPGGSRATGRGSSCARGDRATVSRVGRVRCRMCSWTPRCRARSATAGRSSRPRRRGGRGSGPRGGARAGRAPCAP